MVVRSVSVRLHEETLKRIENIAVKFKFFKRTWDKLLNDILDDYEKLKE